MPPIGANCKTNENTHIFAWLRLVFPCYFYGAKQSKAKPRQAQPNYTKTSKATQRKTKHSQTTPSKAKQNQAKQSQAK